VFRDVERRGDLQFGDEVGSIFVDGSEIRQRGQRGRQVRELNEGHERVWRKKDRRGLLPTAV